MAAGGDIEVASLLSPCNESVIHAAVEVIHTVFTIITFTNSGPPAWAKVSNRTKALLRTNGTSLLNGWKDLIVNVRNATTASAKLTAVGKLVSTAFNQGGKFVLQAFKENLSWWDWVRFSVSIVMGIGAFAVSGGSWLTVKLVNAFESRASLKSAIEAVVRTCA